MQASMSTSPVSCCWAIAATSPFASRLSRAAMAGSSDDGRTAPWVTPVLLSSSPDPTKLAQGAPPWNPRWAEARSFVAASALQRRIAGQAKAYHRGVSYASDERAALCALLKETGPDAPTLCEGWRTSDLAAHLVLRERRPDAAAGLMGGPLAGHTRRANGSRSRQTPFPRPVEP